MVSYKVVKCKSALSISKLPGLDYSLNPYIGCEHGCVYCYARCMLKDRKKALSWGQHVDIKLNIDQVLLKEAIKRKRGIVGISTVTDPYQPVEARYELTRKCFEILLRYSYKISVQTKSNLILKDIDLIRPEVFDVGVTITTLKDYIAKIIEPKAPPPYARIQVVEEIASKSVETWIFLGPIIPGVNDDINDIKSIIKIAHKTKSKIIYDKLNIKPWVLESLTPTIKKLNPDILESLPKLTKPNSHYWIKTASIVEKTCKDIGVQCSPAFTNIHLKPKNLYSIDI